MNRFREDEESKKPKGPGILPDDRDLDPIDDEEQFSLVLHRINMVLYMVVPVLVFLAIIGIGVWVAFSVTGVDASDGDETRSLLSLTFDEDNIPQLLKAHLEAIGGRESVEQIRSVRFDGRLVSESQMHNYIGMKLMPDKGMLVQSVKAAGTVKLMRNGDAAWQVNEMPDGRSIVTPLKESTKNILIWSLRMHNPFRSLALDGDAEGMEFREIDFLGKPCYELTKPMPDGTMLVTVLDKETLSTY